MTLKNAFAPIFFATLLTWGSASMADEYKASEFLGLDLSRAVLSPKLLGPPTEFAPVAVEARTDRAGDGVRAAAKASAKVVAVPRTRAAHVAHLRVEKPRGPIKARLAKRHSNPLDAQAFDTRIQVWPCRSGGICGWKR
jgi:hypothetical protein